MLKQNILRILMENARTPVEEIAVRLGAEPAAVAAAIAELEEAKVIRGYTAIVNREALSDTKVRAQIEVRVQPRREGGFDYVARRIALFPEVVRLDLVSGSYDLLLEVEGDSLQQVAGFVSARLSTIEGVLSTATLFQLKTYKEAGVILAGEEKDERIPVTP